MEGVQLRGICKRFGATLANQDVNLDLRRGEIHAILGENGAGKSTLMNILSGVYLPDAGSITIDGEPVHFRSPRDAVRRGVGMVHQHFHLADAFTVIDNILLGATDEPFLLNRRRASKRLDELGREHALHVPADAYVWQLAVGEKQKVEILKLLFRGADLLLLDEPTSMLTPAEADELYVALRRLAEAGKYIVFITHKLREVVAVADRVTVLRGGRVVASLPRSEASIAKLGSLMVGGEMPESGPTATRAPGAVVLRIEGATTSLGFGSSTLKNLGLELRRGEVLGIAGVAGNGQVELAECAAGMKPLRSGRIWLDGVDVTTASALSRMRAGLRFVPEDRLAMGLVPQLDITENIMLRDFREPPLAKGFWLDRRIGRARAEEIVRDYDVRTPGIDTPVRSLSGGNQQKILIGREMLAEPTVLIVAQPTRGLDVAAARAVHDRILELRASNAGVLVISEDLDEILQLADRIAVLYDGTIKQVWDRRSASRSAIGAIMGGHFLDAA
jgi:simple sugar transport system ATP-binding protein